MIFKEFETEPLPFTVARDDDEYDNDDGGFTNYDDHHADDVSFVLNQKISHGHSLLSIIKFQSSFFARKVIILCN